MRTKFKITKEYPKNLYVRQTWVNNRTVKEFKEVIKNKKHEIEFRALAASMEPNFTHEISETPFMKE